MKTMQRVHLSKDEKTVLRLIHHGEQDNTLAISGADRYLAVRSLQRKGLVEAVIDYDTIADIRLSYEGKAYMAKYPTLRNPIDWNRVITIATLIVSILALFVACNIIR